MSEFQNRALDLLYARFGEQSVMDKDQRGIHFLQEALELFRAMGGSVDAVRAKTVEVYSKPAGEVVVEIGDVMNSLAGVGVANDVDIVQAAYNTLDDGWKNISVVLERKSKRSF
jgi:hypothetical protein